MRLKIVTKHYGEIDAEMVKLIDTTLFYKTNTTDERWLDVPEGDVKWIGIVGHNRTWV